MFNFPRTFAAPMIDFSKKLQAWYAIHKRELPWRKPQPDPYCVWLSEIILQQTRVAQGLAYYERFVEAFPTVHDLAEASEEAVLKLWQGLGYYTRARNLHHTARTVVSDYDGCFPQSYEGLLRLRGVGDYTAAAIASICFGAAKAVVDGNVYRVLARVYGVELPIDKPVGKKRFKTLAEELLDSRQPGVHNQALMEFGALHCKPQNPACDRCIFETDCVARLTNRVGQLPVKAGRVKVRKRYFHYVVPVVEIPGGSTGRKTLLQQRKGNDIWKNLYEFPLVEMASEKHPSQEEIQTALPAVPLSTAALYNPIPVVHKLSHQQLYIWFWVVDLTDKQTTRMPLCDPHDRPVPVVLQKFMDRYFG